MTREKDRVEARRLRSEERLTMHEIANILHASKSSVHYWTRDIEVDIKRNNSNNYIGSAAMAKKYASKREESRVRGFECASKNLTTEQSYALGLWVAEGAKHRNITNICNCDPDVIISFKKLLLSIGVSIESIKITIRLYKTSTENEIEKAKLFWIEKTGVDNISIYLYERHGSPEKKKWPYGICYLDMFGGGQTVTHSFLDGMVNYILA